MDYYQAIILAVVQGFTEFLPISSSAHLVLVPKLLGWVDQGLTFDVAVHVGTLIAVIMFLRKEIVRIIPAWFSGWQNLRWNNDGLLGWYVILATIPAGLVGLLGGGFIEANLRSIWVIVATTFVFGLLLGWADRNANKSTKVLEDLTWKHTLYVGVAQAFALIPGTSRSGVTMTAMLAAGYSRVASAKFSFLLAVPTITLSGLLKSGEMLQASSSPALDVLLLGSVVSALVALFCMRWFINLIQRVGMMPFVIYRIILAIVIMVLLV